MQENKTKKVDFSRSLYYFKKHIKKHSIKLTIIIIGISLGNIFGAIAPLYLKKLIDLLAKSSALELYNSGLVLLSFYIGYRVLNLVFIRVAFWNLALFDAKVMTSLRQFAFEGLVKHSHSFFVNSFTGSLTHKINKFSRSFEIIWDIFVMQVLPLVLWTGTSLYMITMYSKKVALIFCIGIVAYFIFNFFFIRYKSKYDLEASEQDTKVTAGLSDSISNHLTIQLFTGQKDEELRINSLLKDFEDKKIAQWKRMEVMYSVQAIIFTIVEYFILRYSIGEWYVGNITVGTVILFQIYIIGMISRLFDFSQVFRRLSEAFSDSQDMVDVLDRPIEIVDLPNSSNVSPVHGAIELKKLSFSYIDGQELINEMTLSISAGEKIAFVGVSGAGKSTLFKLLLRLYDRTGGELLLDGKPIESYTQEAMRNSIAFVPQESILFHRTLMENIRYGRRDATDEEVREAAKAAECLDFIEKLPFGFDTLVGERGVKLSGGERQRVSIARAILKNAPILLLDEATSSLDSHGELEIQKALERLMKNKTVIAIAHRLSTIRKMDRIIVLENGKIIEEGTHDSLLEGESGTYKKLWDLQVGGFIQE